MNIGDKEILYYLQDKLSSSEKEAVDAWRSASNANEQEFAFVKNILRQSKSLYQSENLDLDVEWEGMQAIIPELLPVAETDSTIKILPVYRWLVAASFLILIAFFAQKNHNPLLIHSSGSSELVINLPDGSNVELAPDSELRYFKKFGDSGDRYVELDGIAKFDVVANAEQVFLVRANQTTIEVVGTEFIVNTSREETLVEVISGKVNFMLSSDIESNIDLAEGEIANYVGAKLSRYEESIIEIDTISTNNEPITLRNRNPVQSASTTPFGKQSEYNLRDVIQFMKRNFGKKFKKHWKCRIKKSDSININLNGDLDFLLDQIKIYYELGFVEGKCEGCIVLRSVNKK